MTIFAGSFTRACASSAALLLVVLLAASAVARQPAATNQLAAGSEAAAGGELTVPPVPKGTPEQLIEYVQQLKQAGARPKSREEAMAYFGKVAKAGLEASDKALAQLKPADPLYEPAAKAKLESLAMLGRLGDADASKAMTAFAGELVNGPSPKLAKEAGMMLLMVEAQGVLQGNAAGAPALIQKIGGMLAQDPDDPQTVQLAMQLAGAFEHMPGGEEAARVAYSTFGPLMMKSSNEQIRGLAAKFEGVLRRLNLPGNEMEISGTLLDGSPFDPKSVAGKVVLVDFWATWCGPCIAEIPNVLEQYEKYHDKGFEVIGVSLDDDATALKAFVDEKKLPWPVLYEKPGGAGWQHPLATKYGVSGIPTVILVGRDGKVVSLDVRGEKLGAALDKLFGGTAKDPG